MTLKNPSLQNPVFSLISENSDYPFSFHEFLNIVEIYLQLFPTLRYGQAIFNLMDAIDSEFNDKICGTEFDPFNKNENVSIYFIEAFKKGVFKF